MKILFIGTVQFSLKALKKLKDMNLDVVGVCTKAASSYNADFADLTPYCKLNSIPVLHVENINHKDNVEWVKSLEPDIIFCIGWSALIQKEIIGIPKMGVIGFHPSKLPENRGRHPIIWALVLGLEKSASTFFFIGENADDGDILSQEEFPIHYEDDAKSLYKKIEIIALKQLEGFVSQLNNSMFKRVKQNHASSNVLRKRTVHDGKIDFRIPSRGIYNLVRGLTKPYIGAHIELQGKNISVWKVKEIENNQKNIEPGKVISTNKQSFVVKCFDNAIEIIEHEFKILPKIGEYL
jgi:methionyl-tRNA formyltransferase